MNGKANLALISIIAFLVLLFLSCKKSNLTNPTNETTQKKSLGKRNCRRRVVYKWEFYYYVQKSNKKLGFWPTPFASMSEMKTKYGFSKVLVNAGFIDSIDMMASISRSSLTYPSGNFKEYYIDEPAEIRGSDHPRVPLANLCILADELQPSKLIVSSYKMGITDNDGSQDYYLQLILGSYYQNIKIMSDNYYGLFCRDDQTGYWDDYKDMYSARNSSNCVHLLVDGKQHDFYSLFEYAKDNNSNELWLYIGNEPDGICGDGEVLTKNKFDHYLSQFLGNARNFGWLKTAYRKYQYIYKCLDPNPCFSCDQNDISSEGGWVQVGKYPTNQYMVD